VDKDRERFTIRASASRLDKGLLAVPQKFKSLFPDEQCQIHVVFDDEEASRALTFHPYDARTKESRIFGLRNWYAKRSVHQGDLISVTVEPRGRRLYRIALERYLLERQERVARQRLQEASTDSEAEQQLTILWRVTKRRPRQVAERELMQIAQQSVRQSRPIVLPAAAERREGVPPGTRILLRELHEGKCQICSFTFEKRNGEPYFEIHHVDPTIGHHPTNLLVVCPNCHAQLEHAAVSDLKWAGQWLVGLAINGKRLSVRQPLAHDSIRRALFGFFFVIAAIRAGLLLRR
jgi:5-methylcytosine-specific restriction endonuclease McrA